MLYFFGSFAGRILACQAAAEGMIHDSGVKTCLMTVCDGIFFSEVLYLYYEMI
jgi:hypothetical protein